MEKKMQTIIYLAPEIRASMKRRTSLYTPDNTMILMVCCPNGAPNFGKLTPYPKQKRSIYLNQ